MSADNQGQSANFNRPPRLQIEQLEGQEISIPAPPGQQQAAPDQPAIFNVLPLMGIGVMAIFYVFRATTGGSNIAFALPMLFMAVFTIGGTVLAQRWRNRDTERHKVENELHYARLLETKRARLQAATDAQLDILTYNYPPTAKLLELPLDRQVRLWERRADDYDFTSLRIGVGRIPSVVRIQVPDPDTERPGLEHALELADSYRFLNNAPVVVSLLQDTSIGVAGARTHVLQLARSAICNLAVMHSPRELHIHLITSQANYDDWRWLEWLPHASQSQRGGSAELIVYDIENIRNLLGNLGQIIDERKEHDQSPTTPHLLVIVDAPRLVETEAVYSTILREGHTVGASALCLVGDFADIPGDCGAVIEIEDNGAFRYARTGPEGVEIEGQQVDSLSVQDAEHVVRALASVVMQETGGAGRIPRRVDFLDLYGVRSVNELEPKITRRWRRRIRDGVLPHAVPVGRESLTVQTEIMLDEEHHGPHGVLAGTTGAGKSELLQTLVAAMVLEHDPRLLTLLLIDFKGGSTFNVFETLPHTVGTVTNLDSIRVNRALEALKAETEWRQKFLQAHEVRDITQYHKLYASQDERLQDKNYEPLPHLFIIVDEFAQLAKEMPDFLKELVRTVQVGRSLGLHLLLGTQSPMDVITDEMNANLQFRICLRVQTIEASRAMLRRPDAAYLPAGWPGRGYFQVGEQGVFKQFQTAYVGADYEPPDQKTEEADEVYVLELVRDSGERLDLLGEEIDAGDTDPRSSDLDPIPQPLDAVQDPYTVAKAICVTIVDYAEKHKIPWQPPLLLPPLADVITLRTVFDRCSLQGWDETQWQAPGLDHRGVAVPPGSVPVGLIDDVYHRTQEPLWLNLNAGGEGDARSDAATRRDGHVMVMGSPGTGKTTFLRTVAMSLALLNPPDKLHMYLLSFTGGGLDIIGDLPHAEQVIYGTETERVRRLMGRLIKTLNDHQEGRVRNTRQIVFFIDQYEQFRDTYRDQHMADFERLINEGRAAGIYIVFAANSPNSLPDRIRSLVQQRVALQLGEHTEYMLAVGRMQAPVETVLPNGRGFVHNSPPLACQISLPVMEAPEATDVSGYVDKMQALVADMQDSYLRQKGVNRAQATRYNRQSPAPILELPTEVPLRRLVSKPLRTQPQHNHHLITPIGQFDDDGLSVFELDWWELGPHFVVIGPPGSGKTNLLQAAVLSAAARYSPEQVRFLLVDFRGRSLRPLKNLKHVIAHVTDTVQLDMQLTNLQSEFNALKNQHNGDDGHIPLDAPATVVIIDDYDQTSETLVESTGGNDILKHLRDHVRFHSEMGLYIWLAGYMERTTDPLIKRLLLNRSGFALALRDGLQKLSVRITGLPADPMPDGRAYFSERSRLSIVQFALVDDPRTYVEHINTSVWPDAGHARWMAPASEDALREQAHNFIQSAGLPDAPARESEISIDLDTAGLIEDLLGGSFHDDPADAYTNGKGDDA